jgi:putative oxidoreductase
MERLLGRASGLIYGVMRIAVGLMFAQHGAQKLFGLFGGVGQDGGTVQLMSMMGAAGVIEFFGGLLIALGLFGSLAAFVASGQMAVAYFMSHAPRGAIPIENGGERAILFCFIFLFIASHGSGALSLDGLFRKSD